MCIMSGLFRLRGGRKRRGGCEGKGHERGREEGEEGWEKESELNNCTELAIMTA